MLIIHLCLLWIGAWITYLITIRPVIACSLSWDYSAMSLPACSPPTLLASHRNRYVCSAEGFLLALRRWRDSVLFTHSTTEIKMALLLFSVPCDHVQRESFLNEKVRKPAPKHKPLVHEYTHTLLLSREAVHKVNSSNLTQNYHTRSKRINALGKKKRQSNKEILPLPP